MAAAVTSLCNSIFFTGRNRRGEEEEREEGEVEEEEEEDVWSVEKMRAYLSYVKTLKPTMTSDANRWVWFTA